MNKLFVKKTVSCSIIMAMMLFFSPLVFSQSEDDFLDPQLEEDFFETENTYINDAIQKNFTIILTEHNYDLNPHTAEYNAEAQILTGLYEGLFSYDPATLNPVPAIAKSYLISRDKKRWTFTLRDDAYFSDGTKITAESVRESWLSMLKNPRAPYSSLFEIVAGAKEFKNGTASENEVGIYAIEEYSLSVHLTNPAAHLIRLLCMPTFSVISKNAHVYSGPFVLSDFSTKHIVLEKNPYYYDKENTHLEKITFLLSNDDVENSHLFNTGKADWISSSVDLKKIILKSASHISAEFATEYLFFKMRNSIWENTKFRQALLEAVPWQELRANTFVPATTLVYPLNGYPKVQGYVYTDKIEAQSLMKATRKEANIPEDEILELKIAISESERMKKHVEILKEAWSPLGVELKTVEIASINYLKEIAQTDADIFSYTWIGDFSDPLAFLELFKGNSTLNVSNWNNNDFNRMLLEAESLNDLQHLERLSQAEQLLLDEAIIIPIQHPVSLNIIDLDAVGGWTTNAFDIHPLKYIYKKQTQCEVPHLAKK